MLPNGGHAWGTNCYGMRRAWEHMVKILRCEEPPKGFRLVSGNEPLAYPNLGG